jgi:hypothetical protein
MIQMNLLSGRTTVLCTLKNSFFVPRHVSLFLLWGCERVRGKLRASSFFFIIIINVDIQVNLRVP